MIGKTWDEAEKIDQGPVVSYGESSMLHEEQRGLIKLVS